MNVSKVVNKMTRGSYIPTDSVKSRHDDYFSIAQNIRTGHMLIWIRSI